MNDSVSTEYAFAHCSAANTASEYAPRPARGVEQQFRVIQQSAGIGRHGSGVRHQSTPVGHPDCCRIHEVKGSQVSSKA
jgi:hypothetical protein